MTAHGEGYINGFLDAGSIPAGSTRKSDKFRLVAFSIKSTLMGGINRIHDEIPLPWDEIRLDGGWVDLISSEAVRRRFHPNLFGFHLAKQDFIDNRVSSNPNEKAPKYLFLSPLYKEYGECHSVHPVFFLFGGIGANIEPVAYTQYEQAK